MSQLERAAARRPSGRLGRRLGHRLDPETYIGASIPLVEQFVAGRGGVTRDEAKAWAAEQRELGERREFFFACIQFCLTAARPG